MPEIITSGDAQYALDIVRMICTQVGPGLPGTSQERERATIIEKELESHLGVGNVAIEEFTLAPAAFLGVYPLGALFLLAAALLNISLGRFAGISPWVTSLAALLFCLISCFLFIFEFVLGFELIDPLLKQGQSINVVGTLRKPGTTNVKRLLMISGHHDSAPENTWLRLLGYGFMPASATALIGFLTLFTMCLLQMAGVMTGNDSIAHAGTLGWIMLLYPVVPSLIFLAFFNMGRKNGGTVPGAADNLSACALVVAMCRFLVNNPSCIPADTEIRFITFGSEEAGLRGSRRYVERHLDELTRLDARLLNFETVVHPEITILTSDINGIVKNSPGMVKSVIAAAERAAVPHKVSPAFFGVGNDSGPFSRAGLKALTLFPFQVPQQWVAFYHQKWDIPDVLTIVPLLNVLKLTFEWVRVLNDNRITK